MPYYLFECYFSEKHPVNLKQRFHQGHCNQFQQQWNERFAVYYDKSVNSSTKKTLCKTGCLQRKYCRC